MTLGRLDARERQKGMDELIDLMPRIVDAYSDVVCLIAGDGDDRPRLEAKVDALSLGNSVRFCGRVPEHEKADHYRLCDIFSMAGRQEGFGFVFLEALATGAPVVASNLDGSRDAVRDGALGELANPDDPDSLFGAITRALAKPRQVPPGLDYFAFENYVERLRGILRPYSGGFQELA
jgi:glycosyltransferase involved in cell wall biosynthesis